MPSTMIKLKMNPCKRTMTAKPETDMLAECLMTMMSQETSYSCVDYLSMTPWQSKSLRSRGGGAVDEYCREQICEWTYRVADYFRIDREVVAVSLNYLDRLLCSCSCDRSMYKLAATTTLHMAVKVVHPQKMGELGILSDLSRGEFEMKDVANMELHILNRLRWKLNPPTTVAFTVYMLDFINVNLPSTEIEDLYVNASFFAELSVYDYFFVTLRSSTIALACVLNALEGMMHDADFMVLHKVRRLHILTRDLSGARNRLWELYERSEECALHNDSRPFKTVSTVPCTTIQIDNVNSPVSSPVSVTYNELQEKSW
mmetsp:Transcript_18558/g.28055  ORF Transcript_18558/g.28055 Transcript_18558/m.28055 type:complete len:315 (-) Transcript_18558:176-1120(-)